MTTKKKDKLKQSIKSQAIKNPNVKFYFLVLMGIGFGIAGMTLPPVGTIDWSVLILIGQLLILAAAVMGISVNFDLKNGQFSSDCDDEEDENYYITTNYRVLVENKWLDDLQYQCEPTEFHSQRITARFICDRGVSHELVRHRVFSFAQESTRYCNYSKDKFGKELTFIKPSWWKEEDNEVATLYIQPWRNIENCYLTLIENGIKPQDARAILPNALKTEVVMTGFESDWDHFFELRCAKAAHPDMQKLANELKGKFHEKEVDNKDK